MAKIEVDLEVNSGKSKSQAKQAGKEAGEAFAVNINTETKNIETSIDSSTKKAGSKASSNLKSAGKEGGSGFESGVKSGVSGAEGAFGGLDGAIGKVKGAAAGLAAAFSFDAIISGIQSAIEVANEFQEDMGKLQTAAERFNISSDVANETYRSFVGILGETDQSVEAVNQAMNLAGGDTERLAQLTDIAAGAYASFTDALPIESLMEDANETAKVGTVTGTMADAIIKAGLSAEQWSESLSGNAEAQAAFNEAISQGMTIEDAYNAALAEVSDESERAALVTDSLAYAFSDTGQAYMEANSALIEYRKSQSDLNAAISEAGTAFMPFATALTSEAIPAIQLITESVKEFIPAFNDAFYDGSYIQAGESLGNMITDLAGSIIEQLPSFIDAGVQLIGGLALGLIEGLPDLIEQLASSITELVPTLIETALELVTALVEALPDIIQSLVDALPEIINMIVSVFNSEETIQALINAVIALFLALIENLPTIIQILVGAIPQIITALVNALSSPETIQSLVLGFVQLFMAFIEALPQIIAIIIGSIPQIISAIVTAISNNAPTIRQTAIDLFTKFKDGIGSMFGQIGAKAAEIGNTILSKLRSIPNQVISIGQNIVQGLWDGISKMGSWIASKIQGFGEGVLNGLKNFFGIHSPSTLMRDAIGKYIGQGIAVGIPIGFDSIDPMPELGKSIMNSAQLMFAGAGMTTNNNSATYNINQPIMGPDQLAREMRKIQRYGLAGHKL